MNNEIVNDIDTIIQSLQNLKDKITNNRPVPVIDRPGWKKQGRFTYRVTAQNAGKKRRTKRHK